MNSNWKHQLSQLDSAYEEIFPDITKSAYRNIHNAESRPQKGQYYSLIADMNLLPIDTSQMQTTNPEQIGNINQRFKSF